MKNFVSICLIMSLSPVACSQNKVNEKEMPVKSSEETVQKMSKTDEEWRAALTSEEYQILRQKGTERPYSGEFDKHFNDGTYTCAGCGTVLFSSDEKFDAGCGWPSFSDAAEGKVNTNQDVSLGMMRIEITCANCGGHLGHVFDDGPTETKQRYCVNSVSLGFTPDGEVDKNEDRKEK
ncbi:MAG: peptide-methionine (R)-S-oxide reductase MsrB [Flavobacteriales bacterium]|nr:peptide-methionine (R)-S-oxide reductase MsrB [Flavobacteriales bacterium]MBL4736334.1 peptide-methionine (R)-S-oxide reductase MsrB [Flavobacteriales bacterium]